MNILCATATIVLLIAFSAVNLFIPYALAVIFLAIGLAAVLGVPCGLMADDPKGECRLGFC